MTPELKAQWLEALRSGKYPQAKGELRKMKDGVVQGYCCLGVLCELTGIDTNNQNYQGFIAPESAQRIGLPSVSFEDTLTFANGKQDIADNDDKGFQFRAASRNDNGWSFLQLADWIEQQELSS